MKKQVCVDTNVILRLILADDLKLHLQAKEIFNSAEKGKYKIYLDPLVVAEVVWVLFSFYKQEKIHISTVLSQLLIQKWVSNSNKKIMLLALTKFANSNLKYVDAWILFYSKKKNMSLHTFDQDLQKQVSV